MLIPALSEDLCLGFANTRFWRGTDTPTEELKGLPELLGWLKRAAGLEATAVQDIESWARQHPRNAEKLFAEAVELREAMYGAFSALAAGKAAHAMDFAALKEALTHAPARNSLARHDGGYAWRIERLRPSAPDLLAPVLWSAADLMLNAGHRHIRQCANDKCLWLFLDESRKGTRRWCDMKSCGNRAKAHRHYQRRKQGGA